jgi:phenylacetate-coenzyme A ligase PaaK-like adenylate-forming protein
MASRSILINTADFYRARAREEERYIAPRDALDGVLEELDIDATSDTNPIRNSPQFIVLRTSGTTGEPKLLRHTMDFHESVVNNGIEALSRQGLLTVPHTCLIAISRGRLSGGFLFTYEVVRQCGWSILLLGASDDSNDLADLCTTQSVDTMFMAPNNIAATFTSKMAGRFDSVRNLLYIGEMPSPSLIDRLRRDFPHIQLRPFIYSSNDTGPIGIPTSDGSAAIYEVPQNVLVEVESEDDGVTLNGSGQILVSVLGLEDPKLIRYRIGDVGTLTTNSEGLQTIELLGRGEISVKFHLDSIGGSVILYKSVVVEFLKERDIHADNDLIVRIHNDDQRTVVDVNLISEDSYDVAALEQWFNEDFPVLQLRGRFKVFQITDEEAKSMSPNKRRFFIKSSDSKGTVSEL